VRPVINRYSCPLLLFDGESRPEDRAVLALGAAPGGALGHWES